MSGICSPKWPKFLFEILSMRRVPVKSDAADSEEPKLKCSEDLSSGFAKACAY